VLVGSDHKHKLACDISARASGQVVGSSEKRWGKDIYSRPAKHKRKIGGASKTSLSTGNTPDISEEVALIGSNRECSSPAIADPVCPEHHPVSREHYKVFPGNHQHKNHAASKIVLS
jgi:hypothetical protein